LDISAIIPTLSYSFVSLSIPLIAIAVLMALRRRSEIRGFKFFILGFLSQIVQVIIGTTINAVSLLTWDMYGPSTSFFLIAYPISMGASILLISLSYFFLSLGFLSLLGYKTRVNGLAIVGAVLSAISLFVPWFAVGSTLIAPTYVFPLGTSGDTRVALFLPIVITLLNIAIYCFVIGSVFSGRIGLVLIIIGGILAFISPLTYFLALNSAAPWVGLAIPFVSTLIAYFAVQYHPKELERTVPDLTGITA